MIKDGDWVLQNWDPHSGRMVWVYDDGICIHTKTEYQVDDLIKMNQLDRQVQKPIHQIDGIGRKVASVPLNLFFDGLSDALVADDKNYMRRWLNDGDNRAFRACEGLVL